MEDLLQGIRRGRLHEATGAGRAGFAAALAATFAGPLVWIARDTGPQGRETLNPHGLGVFLDPARLIVVRPAEAREVLWCMEQALRSGAAPLVIGETGDPPDLTRSRRLQLAAEAGPATGLCLFTGRPVANASETRWRATPLPGRRQEWACIKDKRGRTGAWEIRLRDPATAHLDPRAADWQAGWQAGWGAGRAPGWEPATKTDPKPGLTPAGNCA